ncbi:hypothetical protein DFS34DRAFT_650184 [Phlyctochytrium arcticum]|nr:hypothetical protein DFS34DRAFT_650184 [Phlyctochytrium arcticum]
MSSNQEQPPRVMIEKVSMGPEAPARSEQTGLVSGKRTEPKDIVILLDGTANTFTGDDENTNIVKIAQSINRDYVDHQNIYHRSGIGTFGEISSVTWLDKARKKISQMTAADMDLAVLGAYKFLMSRYEPGDRVFMFGFSRGSYTAVILCAMLDVIGLLAKGNEHEAAFAFTHYMKIQTDDAAARDVAWKTARSYKQTYCRSVKIHFLGIFDAVASVWDGMLRHDKRYPCTRKLAVVTHLRHAVSLDERRVRWKARKVDSREGQTLKQLWFPGCHCDVGGGYPPQAGAGYKPVASNISLHWMLKEAEENQLRLNMKPSPHQSDPNRQLDLLAPLHDTLVLPKDGRTGMINKWIWHQIYWFLEFVPVVTQTPTKSGLAGSPGTYSPTEATAATNLQWGPARLRFNKGNFRFVPEDHWKTILEPTGEASCAMAQSSRALEQSKPSTDDSNQFFHWSVLARVEVDKEFRDKLMLRHEGHQARFGDVLRDYATGMIFGNMFVKIGQWISPERVTPCHRSKAL